MSKSRNLLVIIVSIILLLAIPLTIYLVKQQQSIRSKAATDSSVSITLSPATNATTLGINQDLEVDVRLNVGTKIIASMDLPITYNPAVLRLDSFQKLNSFDTDLVSNSNTTAGTFRYAVAHVAAVPSGATQFSGVIDVVRLKFKTIGNGSSEVRFGPGLEVAQQGSNSPIEPGVVIPGNYTVGTGTTTQSANPVASGVIIGSPAPRSFSGCVGNAPFFNCPVQGRVFIDSNGNGSWELSEPGVSGILVTLYADSNNQPGGQIGAMITNQVGDYSINTNGPLSFFVGIAGSPLKKVTLTLDPGSYTYDFPYAASVASNTPSIAPSPSPSASAVSNTGPCTMTSLTWSAPGGALIVNKGTIITVTLQATGNCAGKTPAIDLYKANSSLGAGRINGFSSTTAFNAENKSFTTWPSETWPGLFGHVEDGGPSQFYFTAIMPTQGGEIRTALPNVKVREAIPNKVRVANVVVMALGANPSPAAINPADVIGDCNQALISRGQVFDYPTVGAASANINWNITTGAPTGPGQKVVCAEFGYLPTGANVTDFQSYAPIVLNVINLTSASVAPSSSPSSSPSQSASASVQPSVSLSPSASVVASVSAGCVQHLNGDADGINGVDVTGDFLIWRSAYLNGYDVRADFNCSGAPVDITDFLLWRVGYLARP